MKNHRVWKKIATVCIKNLSLYIYIYQYILEVYDLRSHPPGPPHPYPTPVDWFIRQTISQRWRREKSLVWISISPSCHKRLWCLILPLEEASGGLPVSGSCRRHRRPSAATASGRRAEQVLREGRGRGRRDGAGQMVQKPYITRAINATTSTRCLPTRPSGGWMERRVGMHGLRLWAGVTALDGVYSFMNLLIDFCLLCVEFKTNYIND